jgi:hypothetical protein
VRSRGADTYLGGSGRGGPHIQGGILPARWALIGGFSFKEELVEQIL